MKKICIHDYDKRYVRDTKRIEENKNVSKKNKELVFKFCDACLLNDMSKARITKYLSFFFLFFKHFNKDLDKATREVRVRVTRNQLERIKLNAQAKGFKTVSGYIRHLCLEHNDHIESKILETHQIVKEFSENYRR